MAVAYTLKIRGGADTYIKSDGKIGTAGKGALVQVDKSATLGTSQDQYVFVPLHGNIAPPLTQVTTKGAEKETELSEKLLPSEKLFAQTATQKARNNETSH